MYRILVVGTGYVGTAVAAYFRSKNQNVWGVIRTEKRKSILESLGVQPIVADITQPDSLENIPPAHFILLSPAPHQRDDASYRKVYLEGIGHMLDRIKRNPKPYLVVYLSSTGVYGDCQGSWVDEHWTPVPDSERGEILLEAEKRVLDSGLPAVIFRLAGIYGPGRNFIDSFRQGKWPERDHDRYLNMIHVEDIVSAMPVLFNKAQMGSIYLGVDDEPVKRSEFCRWLGQKLGLAKVNEEASLEKNRSGKRCSNKRLKELGFSLKYPTFREGYEAILGIYDAKA